MCPRCSSLHIRRSRKHTLNDWLMKLASRVAYRCRDCNKRFYVNREVDKKLARDRQWEKQRTASRLAYIESRTQQSAVESAQEAVPPPL